MCAFSAAKLAPGVLGRLVLVDAVDPQPVGETLARQQNAHAVALAGAAGTVPAAMAVLVLGASVVNVTGAEAAPPNGTPPSIVSVPADQGYVRATVLVSTRSPRRGSGACRSGTTASQPARCS